MTLVSGEDLKQMTSMNPTDSLPNLNFRERIRLPVEESRTAQFVAKVASEPEKGTWLGFLNSVDDQQGSVPRGTMQCFTPAKDPDLPSWSCNAAVASFNLVKDDTLVSAIWEEFKTSLQDKLNSPLDPDLIASLWSDEQERLFDVGCIRCNSVGRTPSIMAQYDKGALLRPVLNQLSELEVTCFSHATGGLGTRSLPAIWDNMPEFDQVVLLPSSFQKSSLNGNQSPYLLGILFEPQLLVCEQIQMLARKGFSKTGGDTALSKKSRRAAGLLRKVWITALIHNVRFVRLSDDWYTIYFSIDGNNLHVGPTMEPVTVSTASKTRPSLYQALLSVVWKSWRQKEKVLVQEATALSRWPIWRLYDNPFQQTAEELWQRFAEQRESVIKPQKRLRTRQDYARNGA